jgi:hypothetical protein
MSARHSWLSASVGMVLAVGAAGLAAADEPAGPAATQPASWQSHSYQFHFMGFTATYSCDGLGDKLQLLLRLTGARANAKVMPSCARGYGVPDRLAAAQVVFSTLQPADGASAGASASAAESVQGAWRHVELAPQRPFELQAGDCELVEQFRDTLLKQFVTRNLSSQISCVPHQQSGSFSLSFDVFAPLPKAKPS